MANETPKTDRPKPVQGTRPETIEERESPRRGEITREPHVSSTSDAREESGAGEPGEDVLGGADAVPLTNDTPPKYPDPMDP